MKTTSLKCRSCGAPLDIAANQQRVACPFCGVVNQIEAEKTGEAGDGGAARAAFLHRQENTKQKPQARREPIAS